MTQVRKLHDIPRIAATPRAGFSNQGDLPTKGEVVAFIEGYARRMRSLSRNPHIPRAQCRVAQQNAGAALRLLNVVRPRSEKDLLDNPVDVFAQLNAIKAKEAEDAGDAPESADPEDFNTGEDTDE